MVLVDLERNENLFVVEGLVKRPFNRGVLHVDLGRHSRKHGKVLTSGEARSRLVLRKPISSDHSSSHGCEFIQLHRLPNAPSICALAGTVASSKIEPALIFLDQIRAHFACDRAD